MKKFLIMFFSIGILTLLCSCGVNNDGVIDIDGEDKVIADGDNSFSDKYLIGHLSGNGGWGDYDYWQELSFEYRICYDGTVEIYMPAVVDYEIKECELVGTYKIPEDDMDVLIEVIDQQKLYNLDPEENYDILDGSSKTLCLYDKDDNVLKNCGGYMPSNSDFMEMYTAVMNTIDLQEHYYIRQEWIRVQKMGLFESFLNDRIKVFYEAFGGDDSEGFLYSDISQLGEGEEWCEIRYDETNAYADIDNDGEMELTLWGPYGGFFIDETNGLLYLMAQGEGTALVLDYAYSEDEVWLVYSDTTHSGRELRHFVKYEGYYIVDEFELMAEYGSLENDGYDETSTFTYRDEEITMEEYEQILSMYSLN